MNLILVGQPYSGKTTLFNHVVGYKALAANTPGSSFEYNTGETEIDGEKVTVVDLPGIYSLENPDESERATVEYLLEAPDDAVIINVVDASLLSRSLELTLQLIEMGRRTVVALNMMGEAKRKGISIDSSALSAELGVPVIETVGRMGRGVNDLFRASRAAAEQDVRPASIEPPRDLEHCLQTVVALLAENEVPAKWPHRFMATKLVERDEYFSSFLRNYLDDDEWERVQIGLTELEERHGQPSEQLVSAFRHNQAFVLFEKVATVGSTQRTDIRQVIDQVVLHPVLGYVLMVATLWASFWLIFETGNRIEPFIFAALEQLSNLVATKLGRGTVSFALVSGVLNGFGGGVGIVIPYLLPFFIFLSFIEATGYLARIAFLVDNAMHRIGLHGMSVIPIILGYGCSVPGVLATRILKSPRDKLITATLTTLVPCSARMTVIFALVGFFISIEAALLVYVLNLVVLGVTGRVMSILLPEISPGMIMEMPRYRLPSASTVLRHTWLRLREFVIIAIPMLIVGSIILEAITHFGWTEPLNAVLAPFTVGVLGLPEPVGITLLFGLLRKELVIIMVFQALGTQDLLSVMSPSQIFGYVVFATFYVPCVATIAALAKELRWQRAILVTLLTFAIAVVLAVATRIVFAVLPLS